MSRREELSNTLRSVCSHCDGVEVAFLFGSRATGKSRAESDLDLAVIYAPGLSDEDREEVRRRLAGDLGQALGELGDRADVVDLERTAAAVAFRALCDGIPVHVGNEQLRARVAARIMRRHDDEAPRRRLFRQAAIRAGRRMQKAPDGR